MREIDAKDLDKIIGKKNIIDIREEFEVNMLELKKKKGVFHIEREKLLNSPVEFLNRDEEYYIMCASGGRSFSVTKELENLGYKVVNVNGGIESYRGENIIIHMKELLQFYK